jgi:hypothetical protein
MSMRACDAPSVITTGEATTSTVGNCQIKYFQPACQIPPGATLKITVTEPAGRNFIYASTVTSQPGPYNYEYKNESAGTKTLLIPYNASAPRVVVAVKGAASGTAAFTLDAWVDVFADTQRPATMTVQETVASGTVVFTPPVYPGASLVYAIVSGNTGNVFDINASTGAISVGPAGLDYETQTGYVGPTAICKQRRCFNHYS